MEQIFPYLLWGGLFFLMMRFGCGSHMFGHRNGNQPHAGQDAHDGGNTLGCCGPSPKTPAGGPKGIRDRHMPSAKYRDPVCGKSISADTAKTSFQAGAVHYFCSRDCREIFEAAPEAYLSGDAAFTDSAKIPLIQNRPLTKRHSGQPTPKPEG